MRLIHSATPPPYPRLLRWVAAPLILTVTDLVDIIDRFQAVLEAAPLSLTQTKDAFTHDRQPNALLDATYYVDDGGLISDRPVGNDVSVRIDRLVVYVALKLKFDPQAAKEAMEATLITAERYIKADGPDRGYHAVFSGQRRVTRVGKKDFLIGSIAFNCDYDFDGSTAAN